MSNKYQAKPVVVRAVQHRHDNEEEFAEFVGSADVTAVGYGDWVVIDAFGNMQIVTGSAFKTLYESIDEGDDGKPEFMVIKWNRDMHHLGWPTYEVRRMHRFEEKTDCKIQQQNMTFYQANEMCKKLEQQAREGKDVSTRTT